MSFNNEEPVYDGQTRVRPMISLRQTARTTAQQMTGKQKNKIE